MKPSVVVSLGTGAPPVSDVPVIDVFRPDSIYGVAKIALMATSLGQLLIDQVCLECLSCRLIQTHV